MIQKDYTILQAATDVAIVVGNEGQGVSDDVIDLADVVVTIPMFGKAESLNVAIASALLMYKTKEMKGNEWIIDQINGKETPNS